MGGEWVGRRYSEILLPETTIIILLIFREHNDNIARFSILSFERNCSLEIIVDDGIITIDSNVCMFYSINKSKNLFVAIVSHFE